LINRNLRVEFLEDFLEDRRMLAAMTVTSLSDGSLEDLAGDGEMSLRDATNETVTNSGAGRRGSSIRKRR